MTAARQARPRAVTETKKTLAGKGAPAAVETKPTKKRAAKKGGAK